MLRQRRTLRLAPQRCACITGRGGAKSGVSFSRGGLELLEFQLHLVKQLAPTFGGCAEAILTQSGDRQLQLRHQRLGARGAGFRLQTGLLGDSQCGAQGKNVVGRRQFS